MKKALAHNWQYLSRKTESAQSNISLLSLATKNWSCVDTPCANVHVMQKQKKVCFANTFQKATEIEWSELSQGNN